MIHDQAATPVVSALYFLVGFAIVVHQLESYVILQAFALLTNQFSCTPHLHGWLFEKTSWSPVKSVIHDTKSLTFLLIVDDELNAFLYAPVLLYAAEVNLNDSGKFVIFQFWLK